MKTVVVSAAILDRAGPRPSDQRKSGTHLAGAWEFPGGKVEAGEDPREALQRELREELGIEVQVGEIVDVTFHRYPTRRGRSKAVLLLFFEARRDAGSADPRALDVAAVRWARSASSTRESSLRPTSPCCARSWRGSRRGQGRSQRAGEVGRDKVQAADALRRPRRRSRHLRHRRGLSPADALPGQDVRDPRGARARSAAPGTCSAIPGIRSDSDMYTLGYSFRPWTQPQAIADGPAILKYLRETAEAYGIDRKIRYGLKVDQRALVERAGALDGRGARSVVGPDRRSSRAASCSCAPATTTTTRATRPSCPARSASAGASSTRSTGPRTSTTQGKRVVVIGSGATAVTLVPELAKRAAHVTMLQRSPTYVVSAPEEDRIANWLRERLPAKQAYSHHALEERAASGWPSTPFAALARRTPRSSSSARSASSSGATPTSTATSRRRTSPGTSACAWCPTAICSTRSGRGARRS